MVNYPGRIGIFGGTFDPVHTGHLIIAEYAREMLKLDKIVFVPNGNPPHKNSYFTEKIHRFEMLQIAVEDNKYFDVSDIEIKKDVHCYTLDTLFELKKIFFEKIFFIMGADSLISIKTWYKYTELLKICNFVVFPRIINDEIWNNGKLTKWLSDNLEEEKSKFYFVDFPILEISSSEIRSNLLQKKSVKYLVPSKVIEYIFEKGLYYY